MPDAIRTSNFDTNIDHFWANVKWEKERRTSYEAPGNTDGKTAVALAFEEARKKKQRYSVSEDADYMAATLRGDVIEIYDDSRWFYGQISVETDTAANKALQIDGTRGLRLYLASGNVHIQDSNGCQIVLQDGKLYVEKNQAARKESNCTKRISFTGKKQAARGNRA